MKNWEKFFRVQQGSKKIRQKIEEKMKMEKKQEIQTQGRVNCPEAAHADGVRVDFGKKDKKEKYTKKKTPQTKNGKTAHQIKIFHFQRRSPYDFK